MKQPKGTAFLLVGCFKTIPILFSLLALCHCSDAPEVRSDQKGLSRNSRSQHETAVREKRAAIAANNKESRRPTPAPFRAPAMSNSMEQVLKDYKIVIDNLGKGTGTEEFNLVEERLPFLKQNLAQILKINVNKLSFLTNPETESGWFADVAVVSSKDGDAYFVDKQGRWFGTKLKDRVIGGVFRDAEGKKQLLTVFYGPLSSNDFYRAYIGTQPAKVLAFNLDRQNDGSISGKIQLPNGNTLIISRTGRDNSKISVNDSPLVPLFQ